MIFSEFLMISLCVLLLAPSVLSSPLDDFSRIANLGNVDILPVDNGLGTSFRKLKHVPQPQGPYQIFVDPDLLSDVSINIVSLINFRSMLVIVILLKNVQMDFRK